VRQERILLRLIEAVDFVDEHDRPRAILLRPLRVRHHLLDLFDPRQHCRKLDVVRLGEIRNDLGQRRLPGPGRPPENHRSRVVALDLCAQRLSRSYQVLLPDELFQRPRTHPVGQRPCLVLSACPARNGLE